MVTIGQVMLMLVGFALKAEIAIRLHPVAARQVAPGELYDIPHVEAHDEHLTQLQGVYVFVVELHLAHLPLVAAAEHQSADVDGKEATPREMLVIDYFHLCYSLSFMLQIYNFIWKLGVFERGKRQVSPKKLPYTTADINCSPMATGRLNRTTKRVC